MTKEKIDIVLLMAILFLVGVGIVFVYSSSSVYAGENFNDQYHFLKKQIFFSILGLIMMLVAMRVDSQRLRKWVIPITLLSLLGLGLALVGPFKLQHGMAHRWVRIGLISFQPSEFTKIALVIYLAHILAKKNEKIANFSFGLLPVLIVTGLSLGLIIMEPDFGTCVVLGMVVMVMLIASGARLAHVGGVVLGLIPIVTFFALSASYRKDRILTFLDPWRDPLGKGFQLIQSKIAFTMGGIWGVGLGQSKQKLFYLPKSHTDYIYALISEEVGFVGSVVVMGVFILIFFRSLRIVLRVSDDFHRLLVLGLASLITIQALVNISVAQGLLPSKGLTLPFMSYGGSSLIASMLAIGLILNVSKEVKSRVR